MRKFTHPKNNRWIIVIFLFSLLVQIQTVFACRMSPEQIFTDCCCDQQDAIQTFTQENKGLSEFSDSVFCCDIVSSIVVKATIGSGNISDNDPIDEQALASEPFKLSLPLLVIALGLTIDEKTVSPGIYRQSTDLAHPLPTYQITERYRI